MAHLPVTKPRDLDEPLRLAIVEGFTKGLSPADIARQLEPEDRTARKNLRRRIWRMAGSDPVLHERVLEKHRSLMVAGLLTATEGLVKRAGRGRIDAVKLLYEASGVHNPKVRHEHSGEITVKLDMPRPNFDAVEGTAREV